MRRNLVRKNLHHESHIDVIYDVLKSPWAFGSMEPPHSRSELVHRGIERALFDCYFELQRYHHLYRMHQSVARKSLAPKTTGTNTRWLGKFVR
jgi:hypothetical protein